MNLKSLKKEDEKMQKKLQKYKQSILELILKEHDYKKDCQIGYTVKFSDLNKMSLSPDDNIYEIQVKRFVELIEKATSFSVLYNRICDYKNVMWNEYRIRTHSSFEKIIDKIKLEIN